MKFQYDLLLCKGKPSSWKQRQAIELEAKPASDLLILEVSKVGQKFRKF